MTSKRLAVFASGRGSNFRVILEHIKKGFIPADIGVLITNNPKAGAIATAQQNGIAHRVINPADFADTDSFNTTILQELDLAGISYIVLAGYLKLIGRNIVDKYKNRILNIHPALLPGFGGKGMYGHHVHQAVFDHGVKLSGATVHIVTTEFDEGPIVLQESVSITDLQAPREIAERVLEIEHRIFPQAVKLLVEGRLRVEGRRVIISGE